MIAFRPTQARCTLLFCLVALVVTINALPAFAGIAVTGPASSSALGTGAFTSQQAFLMRPVLTSVAVGYTSSGAGAIVVTTNGGATWTIRKSPPESVGLNAISCSPTKDCVAVGGTGSRVGPVIVTRNGGATWVNERRPSGLTSASYLTAISCPSAKDCVAVGMHVHEGNDLAVTTTDGGATWLVRNAPSGVANAIAVSCPSTKDCFVVGNPGPGTVGATTNGGATWANERILSPVDGALNAVSCPSTRDCVVVGQVFAAGGAGDLGFVATRNGGTSWVTEKVPSGVAGLGTISCPSMKDCFVVADNPAPTVIATRNGGTTWVTEKLPSLV